MAAYTIASMADFYLGLGMDDYCVRRLRAVLKDHGWAVNGTVWLE